MNGRKPKPVIIAGSTYPEYAEAVAKYLEAPLINREIDKFSNGEININILDSIPGVDSFIIQTSLTGEINDNIMETILLTDALIRARVNSVTLIQLCYPYARKDRKEDDKKTQRPKRCPISAKVVADLYQSIGINRVVTYHLHAPQVVGFFSNKCPCENIVPFKIFAEYLDKEGLINENTIMAGPDIGAAKQTDSASNLIGLDFALVHKSREGQDLNVDRLDVIGDVVGKDVIMYDDILDSGGTAIKGAEKLKKAGANKIILLATHGVLSRDAVDKLAQSVFEKIIITDTIPNKDILKYPNKFVVVPTVAMTADIIANLFNDESLEAIVKHNIKSL